MAAALPPQTSVDHGLLVLLPAAIDDPWRWWRVGDDGLGDGQEGMPIELHERSAEGGRVVALVPSDRAPVRVRPLAGLTLAQATSAARLEAAGPLGDAGPVHAAVAAASSGDGVLVATVAPLEMDAWLAALAGAGLEVEALVPLAAVLPEGEAVAARIGGQDVARTGQAAFAAEPELLAAFGAESARELGEDEIAEALLRAWRDPPLNLRQGAYAPRRVSFFRLPAWRQLAAMAGIAALLVLLIFAVETAKLQWDANARESAALAAAQARFPAAVDLATAQSLVSAELARRGQGGGSFAAPASAVLAAMRPIPSLKLRDMGYSADGTLRFQAAAPSADDVNRLLLALQQDGWQVTVPPSLAPDPTGATVAAITVRAP